MFDMTIGEAERLAKSKGAVLAGKSFYPKPYDHQVSFVYFFNAEGLDIGHYFPALGTYTEEPNPRIWADCYKDKMKFYNLEK